MKGRGADSPSGAGDGEAPAPSPAPRVEPAVLRALDLDRVVHEPARLVILSVLATAEEVEFTFLQAVTGLTKGNLSRHMSKLEEAGYVEVRKYHKGKIPATGYRMTPAGRDAFAAYWERLQAVGEHVRASTA